MRNTLKRQRKLDEIKELAEKLGITVDWADMELANYTTLCLIGIKFQLALPEGAKTCQG